VECTKRYASELPRKSSPGIQPLQASNVVENLKYTLKLPSALWDEAILGLKVDPQGVHQEYQPEKTKE
jgi:hypothetical protein